MSFKPGDRVVVKQSSKGVCRPATFLGYDKNFSDVCKVRYAGSSKAHALVFEKNVILLEVYLSPLYKAMEETDET